MIDNFFFFFFFFFLYSVWFVGLFVCFSASPFHFNLIIIILIFFFIIFIHHLSFIIFIFFMCLLLLIFIFFFFFVSPRANDDDGERVSVHSCRLNRETGKQRNNSKQSNPTTARRGRRSSPEIQSKDKQDRTLVIRKNKNCARDEQPLEHWHHRCCRRMLGEPAVAAPTILELAEQTPELSTLVAAVKAAGIEDVLNGPGPLTVFAPTNAAFGRAPMVSPRDTPSSPSLSFCPPPVECLDWIGEGVQFSCLKS